MLSLEIRLYLYPYLDTNAIIVHPSESRGLKSKANLSSIIKGM